MGLGVEVGNGHAEAEMPQEKASLRPRCSVRGPARTEAESTRPRPQETSAPRLGFPGGGVCTGISEMCLGGVVMKGRGSSLGLLLLLNSGECEFTPPGWTIPCWTPTKQPPVPAVSASRHRVEQSS